MDIEQNVVTTLVEAAREVRNNAYAPYSGFRVGAALLAEDGRIIVGCNVENSSYSLTCCAERSAVFTALSAGIAAFHAVAISADGKAVPPCGACRQVLSEFGPELTVILDDPSGTPRTLSLVNLLPEPFTPDFLKK
ncbi:MAG: cytidine deaminase [Ignavibacteria bacterium]|nr:MAG: cytidine deaminase [Ignavibacteria bacterium]